jgi:hypothetical protein
VTGDMTDVKPQAKPGWDARRAMRVSVRTLHIAAVVGVLGGALYGAWPRAWFVLLFASGVVLAIDDFAKLGLDYFRFVQGWAAVVKLACLMVGLAAADLLVPLCWIALVIGSIVSHAPGRFRQYALWGKQGPCAEPRG